MFTKERESKKHENPRSTQESSGVVIQPETQALESLRPAINKADENTPKCQIFTAIVISQPFRSKKE